MNIALPNARAVLPVSVIPTPAGIQVADVPIQLSKKWIPAYAGMTGLALTKTVGIHTISV